MRELDELTDLVALLNDATTFCDTLADRRPDQFDGRLEMLEAACRLAGRILLHHHDHERERAAFRGDAGCMLFVADHSGHGIEAAGMAARARYALAGVARHADSPAGLLTEANDLLAGLSPDAHFAEAETTLEQGDVLTLITDGVLDSRKNGRLFGLEGIRAVWLANDPTDVLTLTRAVCEASGTYHDSALPPDDRLALGVRLQTGGRMPERLLKNEALATRMHWPARYGVLGRARSAATSASCVLVSRLPIAPWRRSVTFQQPRSAT